MTRLLPLAGAALAGLVAPQAYARLAAAGRMHRVDAEGFRPADAALVLGARVWPDGRPSRALRQRVETGAALYHRGLVPRLVLTGAADNREGLDETEAMERTALALGVPAEALVRDGSGHDTRASARNARDALGLSSVIVCTQEFHVPRAMWLCRSVGLDTQGAFPPILSHPDTRFGYVREIPATWKAALEIARDAIAPHDAPR
ncbi:SanA/YdcF family protein [Demequina mangrovi]|uniref:Protein SanA, affects membrane permeability for vancomycin n=1 Tax=Demequina mangrovi TaxID=1043493 RepID=A0A1H6XXT7_9MICO|nr:YdcF family protein [Demequina mangrovi]SEJ32996.1 protein SanA, affects membrane permeability for vancomycin [Demequina mangrovi]